MAAGGEAVRFNSMIDSVCDLLIVSSCFDSCWISFCAATMGGRPSLSEIGGKITESLRVAKCPQSGK